MRSATGTTTEVLPGLGSMLSVVGGVLVLLISPLYAAVAFADDADGTGWSMVGLAVSGVAAIVGGVRLRRGGVVPQVLVLGFAVVCATAGIAVQARHGTTKAALLLGALGVALPLFMIAEKGWLSPSPEAPPSDG